MDSRVVRLSTSKRPVQPLAETGDAALSVTSEIKIEKRRDKGDVRAFSHHGRPHRLSGPLLQQLACADGAGARRVRPPAEIAGLDGVSGSQLSLVNRAEVSPRRSRKARVASSPRHNPLLCRRN